MLIPFLYKWVNSNSLGSFGSNFWGRRVKKHNNYQDCIDSWSDKLLRYFFQIGRFAEKGSKRTCEHYGWQSYPKVGKKTMTLNIFWGRKKAHVRQMVWHGVTRPWGQYGTGSIRDYDSRIMIHDDIFHVKDEQGCSILIIFPSVPRLNVESIRNHPIDGNYSLTIWLDSPPLSCASRPDSTETQLDTSNYIYISSSLFEPIIFATYHKYETVPEPMSVLEWVIWPIIN